MRQVARNVCYIFLCALPFLGVGAAAARPLRIDGGYQVAGAILFLLIVTSAWTLGAHVIASGPADRRRLAATGALFILPWALITLLWVGIGAPFQATPQENHMRFLLLIANSILVSGAFVLLKDELTDAGEHFCRASDSRPAFLPARPISCA